MGNLVNFAPPKEPPPLFESFWDEFGNVKLRVAISDAVEALKYATFR